MVSAEKGVRVGVGVGMLVGENCRAVRERIRWWVQRCARVSVGGCGWVGGWVGGNCRVVRECIRWWVQRRVCVCECGWVCWWVRIAER